MGPTTTTPGAGSAAPTVLPWRYPLTICAAALGLGVAGYLGMGSPGSMAATAGFAVGLFAALSGGVRGALIAGLVFIAAASLLLAFPVLPVLLAISVALAVIAAVEGARLGSRMAVMVMLGVILCAMVIQRGGDARMLALAVAGLGVGYGVTAHLHLSGILPPARISRAEAVRLGLFLACGSVLSIGLAMAIDVPNAYWIVILFLSRCLMPTQHKAGALIKYGHGAALGVLAAILIEVLALPDPWRLLLALAGFVLGLRFILHPLPISSAAMTAGLLLASAPTAGAAAFRIEAVVLVIALILFLTLLLDRIMPGPPQEP